MKHAYVCVYEGEGHVCLWGEGGEHVSMYVCEGGGACVFVGVVGHVSVCGVGEQVSVCGGGGGGQMSVGGGACVCVGGWGASVCGGHS